MWVPARSAIRIRCAKQHCFEGNPSGPKCSPQTPFRFPTPPQGMNTRQSQHSANRSLDMAPSLIEGRSLQGEENSTGLDHVDRAYVNMVYAAALRQVGDMHVAEDVTQAVFVVLARRVAVGKLPKGAQMAGWLLTAVHYAVKEAKRAAVRRGYHERRAASMRTESVHAVEMPEDNAVLRILDDALMKLGAVDQELIARRYLNGEAVNEIATALSIRENTAGKRIARALERLRKLLSRRGIVMPAAAIAGVMASETSRQASAALLSTLGGASLKNATAILAKHVLRRFIMAKVYAASLISAGLLVAVSGVFVAYENIAKGAPGVAATEPATQPAFIVSSVTEVHSDRLLKDLAAALVANRQELKTLRVQATATTDAWNPQKKQWEPIGRCEGTAWVEVLFALGAEVVEPLKAHIESDHWLGAARTSQGFAYRTALNEGGIAIPMQYDPSDVALPADFSSAVLPCFSVYCLEATTHRWGSTCYFP